MPWWGVPHGTLPFAGDLQMCYARCTRHIEEKSGRVCKRPDDTEHAELFTCLKAVIRHNRDFLPCTTYLSVAPKLNTLNLHALLQATLKISAGGKRGECTEFILDVMKFITRVGHDVDHATSVAVYKSHFHLVLCRDLSGHRANQGAATVW